MWSNIYFMFVLSTLLFKCLLVESKELKIGVMDWQSIDSIEPLDDGQSLSMTLNFLLAVAHFNERRDDIIPVLGEEWVQNCDVNLTVVRYCDTQALLRKSASDTTRLVGDVDAIVGYATAAEGSQNSLIADVSNGVPVVSHWCTTPITEARTIYKMFARTVVSDSDMAVRMADFLTQLGYTRVAGLAMIQDSSPELRSAIQNELIKRGCLADFFDYDYDDEESIETAVRNVAETGFNIIIIIGYNFIIQETLADYAKQYNLTIGDKLILFTNMDFDLDSDTLSAYPNANELVRGAFRISTRLPEVFSSTVESYKQRWISGEFGQFYTDFANTLLPPNGLGNDSFFCEHDRFNMTITPDFFSQNVDKYTEFWGIAYDTVLSVGLGACLSNGTRFQEDLMADILSLSFVGLSGQVAFDSENGNRLATFLEFQVQNFQPTEDGLSQSAVTVGIHNITSGRFDFIVNESSLVFRGGLGLQHLPAQFDAPETDFNHLPLWLQIGGRFEFACIMLFAIGGSFWLIRYKKEAVVINSQGPLMHTICLGCGVAGFSILLMTFDDQHMDINMDRVCMSIPVLFTLGFQIALLGLCGKTYRIYAIWNNNKIMTRKFSLMRVVIGVALLVLFEFAVLISWIAVAPLTYQRLVLSRDRYGQPLASLGMCDANTWTSGAFAVVVFIIHGISLVIMGFLAYQVSDMPGEFGEARWLGLACLTLSQIYLICLPAIAAVYSVNVVGRFLLSTSLVFFSAFALLFFMFAPKMYFLATGKEMFRKTTTNSRLQLADSRQNLAAVQNRKDEARASKNSSKEEIKVMAVMGGSSNRMVADPAKIDQVTNALM